MKKAYVIGSSDPFYAEAAQFVRDAYKRNYGAEQPSISNNLLCRRSSSGDISCVAGLRLSGDGFFSEQYLSKPAEAALSAATGRHLNRDDIFEVSTLVSRAPRELAEFIDDIMEFGAEHGLSWSFFTLTDRLAQLVARRGLSPIYLADADPARVTHPEGWGRYYETRPKVYGVCGVHMLRARAPQFAERDRSEASKSGLGKSEVRHAHAL